MNIAFISQPLDRVVPPSMNSIGIWTYETARRMAETNQVTVFTRSGLAKGGRIGHNVNTVYVRSAPNRWMSRLAYQVDRYNPQPKRPFFSSILYNFEYSLQIALHILRMKSDLAHIQNYSQFVPIIRAFNPKTKIALHMRCEWLTQLDHAMIARRLAQTDMIFGVSNYITNLIRADFPEYSNRCATIANGVDLEQFSPPAEGSRSQTLLMVGRISPEKGVHVLLKAFQEVGRRFPDVRLELVGPILSVNKGYIVGLSEDAKVHSLEVFYQGRYWDHLQALIPDDLRDRVIFRGGVKYYDTIDYYRRSTLLVNPSLSEAFGRSLIEANACGTPVVAARTGGMVEIIEPGYNGLLVEPGSAEALAAAIGDLMGNEPLRREMGINSRNWVQQQYSWDKICADLNAAYRCEMSKRQAAGRKDTDGIPPKRNDKTQAV